MKKIYPRSPLIIIGEIIFAALDMFCLAGIVYSVIEYFTSYDWYYILIFISAVLATISFFVDLLSFLVKKIILQDDAIVVHADIADKDGVFLRRLQHETVITYEEIQDIKLDSTNADSNRYPVKNVFVEMPYIVFACKDGTEKLINVYFYSKNQVINIIDEVVNRARAAGNELNLKSGTEILSEFLETKKH